MKRAHETLANYEQALLQPELVRPAVKYDNRALLAPGLRSWPAAQNRREKLPSAPDLPSNEAAGRWAAGYALALERRTPA